MQVNAEPVIYRWKWKLEDIESAFYLIDNVFIDIIMCCFVWEVGGVGPVHTEPD